MSTARAAALAAASMALCAAALLASPLPALAVTAQPHWAIDSLAAPSDFSTADNEASTCGGGLNAQDCDVYYVTATDVGATAMQAKTVTVEDTLPPGLAVRHATLLWSGIEAVAGHFEQEDLCIKFATCKVEGSLIKATLKNTFFSALGYTVHPDDALILEVAVSVSKPATPGFLTNHVKIEGGGAPSAEAGAINTLEEGSPPFGAALFSAPMLGFEGTPATQAGSHPYELPTRIGFASKIREESHGGVLTTSVEDPRDVLVDLPAGYSGSALSTPVRCDFAQLASTGEKNEQGVSGCPAVSQIGFLRTYPVGVNNAKSAVFNMVPEHGVAAEFGYVDILNGAHVLYVSLVPSPQGYVLRTSSREIPQVQLTQIDTPIYGDPAARDEGREAKTGDVPTLTAPADCSGEALITSIHMDSWQQPGEWEADGEPVLSEPNWATKTYEAPAVTNCEALTGLFNPTIEAHPTTTQADKPSGIEVTIKVPQKEEVGTLATPPLKKAVVTLPEGMTVNPSSANGLEGCSLAQIGVSPQGQPNAEPIRCPDASKLGTVSLKTPALPGTLEGEIYVAKQAENPFNSLLALYIVVDDPATGVLVKIPAEVRADPNTGQLETIVDNSPQFPFSELTTRFFGGQKAALRTPAVCGTYEVSAELTPWSSPESGPPAETSGSFEITGGCAKSAAEEPNSPSFQAGTTEPLAGAYSPFVMHLGREDASQELKGLNVTLPPGLIGKLAGVQECSEAQIATARSRQHEGGGAEELQSPSCPASSEIGTVTVGAGAGLTPYYTSGHAYLAGPYKGAPLSVAIITPAVAGPYDLGAVLVQVALHINPETAQISALSDPLPTILDGIPLDIRSIALEMGRPQFTLNPTNCERMAVQAEATSILGQLANLSDPFQVGGCKALGFHPNLKISLKGSTKRAGHPALRALLTYPQGPYANIARAAVTLPHSEFLDQGHIGTVCTRVQFAEGSMPGEKCPPASIYGYAKAETPLLEAPLQGPVFLRSSSHKLPDLVAALNGQIQVALDGTIDSVHGGIRNRFEVVPDAPVSRFELTMQGGRKGLLVNSTDLCAKPNRAAARFTGQNGLVQETEPLVANSCKRRAKKVKGHHHHRVG